MATRQADVFETGAVTHDADRRRDVAAGGWNAWSLYAGIPAAVCLYLALNNWQLLDAVGFWSTLGFYAAHAAVPWTATALLTLLAYRLLLPWRPGLLFLTTTGSLAACALAVPYTEWLMGAWAPGLTAGIPPAGASSFTWDWAAILGYTIRATLLWVGANWLFDRHLGCPRYRYPERANATEHDAVGTAQTGKPLADQHGLPGGPPAFLQRLRRPATTGDLLALRAEQHYLRVITCKGSELVLYRLGDAVRELPPDLGIQVHRSWWVSRHAVTGVELEDRKMRLVLSDGQRVPVSAPHQALARGLPVGAHVAGATLTPR